MIDYILFGLKQQTQILDSINTHLTLSINTILLKEKNKILMSSTANRTGLVEDAVLLHSFETSC